MNQIDERLAFATDMAKEAGALARTMRRQRSADFVRTKGLQDFVTDADRAVERFIRDRVAARYPSEAVMGEEDGYTPGAGACWVVDPIDGTANYMRGMADWGISIGVAQGDAITHGVIHIPDLDMMAVAAAGQGAYVNGDPVHVSDRARPEESMIALGRSRRADPGAYLGVIGSLTDAGIEYRRQGAAVIGLLGVAAGWTEGYYEAHLNAWDAFAGIVLVREAGGLVECAPADRFLTEGSMVMATNGLQSGLAALIEAAPSLS